MPNSKSILCNPPPFANKTIAITGAATPVGLATATLLYDQGANVACSDSNWKALAELYGFLNLSSRHENRFMVTHISIIDTEQTEAWIGSIVKEFGRLDCAVNIMTPSQSMVPKMKSTTAQFDIDIDLPLRGISNCMNSQLCAMGQGTAVLNVVSDTLLNATPISALHTTIMSHINALTSAAAMEYGSSGVRINAISAVTSPCAGLGAQILLPDAMTSALPLRRAAEPVEVALPIMFLLSDQASYISGAMLKCDGEYGLECR